MSLAVATSQPAGEALDDRTRIERGMLVLLEGLSQRAGGYLATLGPYSGEVGDGDGLEDIIRRLRNGAPAVLVTTSSAEFDRRGVSSTRYQATYQVEILVVSNHWRSREARLHGDERRVTNADADPGAYQILEDVRGRLLGQRLGVKGVHRVEPRSESMVVQAHELVAFRAVWAVAMTATRPTRNVRATHAFNSLHHNHNLTNSAAVNPVAEGEVTNE